MTTECPDSTMATIDWPRARMRRRRPEAVHRRRTTPPAVMHVLHTLGHAGAEVLVRNLAAERSGEFRFIVVALDSGGPLIDELADLGVASIVLDRRPGIDRSCARRIAELVEAHHVDEVHAHQYTPFFYAALAKRRADDRPALVFTEHGRHYPDHRRWKRIIANRLLLTRRADRITAVGEYIKRALVRNEAIPADRIAVIPNGIDAAAMVSHDRDGRNRLRSELGVDDGKPLILQVAGFRPVKDHAGALVALRILRSRRCPAVLAFAGDGPTLEPTRQLAEKMGLTDAVRFLGPRTDVPELWQAADVGLLSSLSEGISVALLEAMAAGRPVVATDVGGNREIVIDGETGYLADRRDAGALADGLHRLCDDVDRRRRFGEAGRLRAETLFSQTAMHTAYAGMYHELCPAHAAEGGER